MIERPYHHHVHFIRLGVECPEQVLCHFGNGIGVRRMHRCGFADQTGIRRQNAVFLTGTDQQNLRRIVRYVPHSVQHVQAAVNVDVCRQLGIFPRIRHGALCRQMQDRVRLVPHQQCFYGIFVQNVQIVRLAAFHFYRFLRQLGHNGFPAAVLQQVLCQIPSYKSAAANDKCLHVLCRLSAISASVA